MNSPHSGNSWIGRLIGDNQRYRLDQRLGGGGMGDVFLATDMRVGNQVALKLLKDTLVASQEMRKRFEREVSVCAALQSDNIVKISDCGVTPEGFPFYVMEYLRGQTLRHVMVREKQLSVERTVSIISQVCKGLHLAHQGVTLQKDGGKSTEPIEVIHRDLKPDNIFLIPTELGEWVKILDFGVAKIRDSSSQQTNITNITSTFLGTFRYAAPEQIQNDKNLDARADIYSLGIILYEMLSAADPFGLSIKSRNISEASWLLAHAHEPPKPLRSQLGCEHLSSEIEAVVMKCLEKKPNDRFATVEELHRALQAAAKLQGSGSVQREQIIIQPQRQYSSGSNDETIIRPVSQVENGNPPNTNLQPQRQYSPGSNDKTILRPISQVEQGDGNAMMMQPRPPATSPKEQHPDGTMMQPRPPATPPGQQRPDGTMMQPRPSANPPAQQHPDGTMMQPRPSANPPAQQHPDGTMMQPRPPATPPREQHSDGTMMQPRPPATPPREQHSDGTMMQPRPPATPPREQHSDGTMMQPRPPASFGQQRPDGTMMQPRSPASFEQQRPDDTIDPSKQNGQQANKNIVNILRVFGLVFAIGMALAVFVHMYPQSQSPQNFNERKLPK